jgi:hypothetical protein
MKLNLFFLISVWTFDSCLTQFTDAEIRNLRRRAKDAGLHGSDLDIVNSHIAESIIVRDNLHVLKKREPHETIKINDMSLMLREKYRELVVKTNPVANKKGTSAAERAIERLRSRRAIIAAEEERQRIEREQLDYVANTRQLKLVDESIRVLQARGVTYELNNEGKIFEYAMDVTCYWPAQDMRRLDVLLESYRAAEANHIFNNTGVKVCSTTRCIHMFLWRAFPQESRDIRVSIEKFISHHQGLAFTNRMRQEELLDKSLRDFAARAAEPDDATDLVICPADLEELDNMLGRYRELSMRVIKQQHLSGSVALEDRKAAQTVKMDIEKYIGLHKKQAKCTRGTSTSSGHVHGTRLLAKSSSSWTQ